MKRLTGVMLIVGIIFLIPLLATHVSAADKVFTSVLTEGQTNQVSDTFDQVCDGVVISIDSRDTYNLNYPTFYNGNTVTGIPYAFWISTNTDEYTSNSKTPWWNDDTQWEFNLTHSFEAAADSTATFVSRLQFP